MAWNWSANKQQNPRERFAGPAAIAGLVGAGLLLLVVLYPEKSLLRLLEAPDVTSPAQQRYLEALVHLRTGDPNLVIILARSYLAAGCTEKALKALEHRQGVLSREQAKTVMQLYYEARRQQLELMLTGEPGWKRVQQDYADQIEQVKQAGATPKELVCYLADARALGDRQTVKRLETLLGTAAGQGTAPAVEAAASAALAKGDYRGAAELYFKGLQAAGLNQKRVYFLAGVRTLQSGNLLAEALTAAERHLDAGLAHDRQTLLYLTRLALAANRPDLAQKYVRRALGLSSGEPSGAATP